MSLQKIILTFCFFLIYTGAKTQILSDKAEISLITCSPGNELYSIFGHSAIRVKDPKLNIDRIYNYGTFDFRTPNFYMKFARGKLKYMLSVNHYNSFKIGYMFEKRSIIEQKLNIDSISRQRLFTALQINMMPENRFYSYDFLFDNCSTRIRDIIKDNISTPINFNLDQADAPKIFWDLLDPYVKKSRWAYLGIRLGLGNQCNKIANPYHYMFLPDHLMNAFRRASINNDSLMLAQKPRYDYLYEGTPIIKPTAWYLSPITLFTALSLTILLYTLQMIRKKRAVFWIDATLFVIIGLLGCMVLFLWFLTDHQATALNFNILWTIPTHIPAALLLLFRKKIKWVRLYFLINALIILITITLWLLIPHLFALAILPLLIIIAVRSLFIYKYFTAIT